MKNRSKFLTGLFLSAILCFAVALSFVFAPAGTGEFKGTYNVNAFASEGEDEQITTTFFATKRNVSLGNDYMLLVTAFNADTSAYQEVGYSISVNGGEATKVGTNKYYVGISLNDSEGNPVVLQASDIYGEEIDCVGLIVYEMEYSKDNEYAIFPYMTPNTNEETGEIPEPEVGATVSGQEKPSRIEIAGDFVVNAGENFENLEVQVFGNFRKGARELERGEYELSIPDENAVFGKGYEIVATYRKDNSIVAKKPVAVSQKLEGATAVLVNGGVKTETEYDSQLQLIGDITFAGGFKLVEPETSATFYINSKTAGTANLVLRMSNGNLRKSATTPVTYTMADLKVNTVMDLVVNGNNVAVADALVIPGCGPNETYIPLYNVYHDVNFGTITLKAGVNAIKILLKASTIGEVNSWNESPVFNIASATLSATGTVIDANATVEEIEIDSAYAPAYGDAIANTPALAIMSDGNKVLLDASEYTVTNGDKDWYAVSNNVTIKLASDETITATKAFATSVTLSVTYKAADLVQEDGKIYYKLTFDSKGYEVSDYNLFDGTTNFAIAKYEHTPTQMVTYVDITGWSAGTTLYPHLKTKGAIYTKINSSGDLAGGSFETGKMFTANGKKYILLGQFNANMPTAKVVSTTEKYLAWGNKKGIYLSVENNKMYYCAEFDIWGYDGATFTLFDGKKGQDGYKAFNVTIPTLTSAYHVVKWDITDLSSKGLTDDQKQIEERSFYPHLAINDATYTGFHSNGDFVGATFTNRATASITTTTSGYKYKTYRLHNLWDMAAVLVGYTN